MLENNLQSENILEFHQVSVHKKDFVIKDATFSIPKGYITVLMGDNGAGKTTLLSMLMGKERVYQGNIYLNGVDIRKNPEYYLDQTGIIIEEPSFFMGLDALDNCKLLGRFYSRWDEEYFRKMMRRLSVSMGTPLGNLSRGNYIKFQFAFAMAHHPQLYVMDEPTAGLDPVSRRDFYELVQELVTEESAVLLSTNIWSDVEQIADYRLDIVDGIVKGLEEVWNEG